MIKNQAVMPIGLPIPRVWRHSIGIGVVFSLVPTRTFAHDFGIGKGAYEDFLSGNQAVLADLPVLLALIAAGVFASIWKPNGFPLLWPSYLFGIAIGALIGFSGFIPSVISAYLTVIIFGLLGAAAPGISVNAMRGLYLFAGIMLCNAVLSGHTISEIPLFAYLGIAFALNVGIAVWAGLVSVLRETFPHGWVMIAWRAGMSWLVAIAVIAMTLMLRSVG